MTVVHDSDEHARLRVLFVASTVPRRDNDAIPHFVLNLAVELQSLGVDVSILAPHAPGAVRYEHLAGVPITRFRYVIPARAQRLFTTNAAMVNLRHHPLRWLQIPCYLVALAFAIARISRNKFDVVHSHWVVPQGAIVAAVARRLPHVITVHGGDVFSLRGRALSKIKGWALRSADVVTVNSSATERAARDLVGRSADIRRIPQGVPARTVDDGQREAVRARFRRDDGPLLGFVGRLVDEKGVADLIKAVAIVSRHRPGVRALIVGDGQDREKFVELAHAEGVVDNVHFAGWLHADEVATYVAACDIFVGPSRRGADGWVEAQGITFAEALAVGTPVVASRSGGIPDIIIHEHTGLLVPEAAPNEIAAAIERLIDDVALRDRLRANGKELVAAELSLQATAHAMLAAYEKALNRRGSTSISSVD